MRTVFFASGKLCFPSSPLGFADSSDCPPEVSLVKKDGLTCMTSDSPTAQRHSIVISKSTALCESSALARLFQVSRVTYHCNWSPNRPDPTSPTLPQQIRTEVSLRDLQKGPNFGGGEERKVDGTLVHHITGGLTPSEHCSLFPHQPILEIPVSILQPTAHSFTTSVRQQNTMPSVSNANHLRPSISAPCRSVMRGVSVSALARILLVLLFPPAFQ
ncbi:hypothetical protein F4604DRAFT_1846905 [Suillus subluteus]|nr:hypothetical protein F4604DRAFT_1846905 [Suillus subluteus]